MPRFQPFVREAGSGPVVLCLHANASSSTQWRGLMDTLAGTHRVVAPDSWSSGRSPRWPLERMWCLDDEVALLDPVIDAIDDDFSLVGHSYGAAVALVAALRHASRIDALVLYEPTLFAVVDQRSPPPNGADGIRGAVAAARAALDAGNPDDAARCFIDFWMGPGSWAATPTQRRGPIAESVAQIPHWEHALFTEPTPLRGFAALTMPVLLMIGEQSPQSAQAVAHALADTLPNVKTLRLPGLGHMAPVTHPELVNEAVASFLR